MAISKLAVLGAGSWGTALAVHAAQHVACVQLWGNRTEHIKVLHADRQNKRHLPGILFPTSLSVTGELVEAVSQAELVLIAVPSKGFAALLQALQPLDVRCGLLSATKGFEYGSGRFLHQVASSIMPDNVYGVLSGPSFAKEVAQGLPTALTLASSSASYAQLAQQVLHHHNMRIYTSSDVVGVEIGGAVKNVLAIAVGISDGLGYGANARAALITRGLSEIKRLGLACGADIETLVGLSGLGDLLLTATDDQSRNRRFGLALGRGDSPQSAEQSIGQVVEGAVACVEIIRMASQMQVDMPIAEQVRQVVVEGLPPHLAVENLLRRAPRAEPK